MNTESIEINSSDKHEPKSNSVQHATEKIFPVHPTANGKAYNYYETYKTPGVSTEVIAQLSITIRLKLAAHKTMIRIFSMIPTIINLTI